MAHGLTGRLPYDRRYWESARALDSTTLSAPRTVNMDFQKLTLWPMDGNNKWGDCVCAEREHVIRLWNALIGIAAPDPSEAVTVQGYEQLSGSMTAPGPGLVIADALEAWHQNAYPDGNALLVPAQSIPVRNIDAIKASVDLNGAVFCGVDLPANAMDQFDAGLPWTLAPGSNPAVDGHGVPIVGYDEEWLYVPTWARIQRVSYKWWHYYGGEAWHVTPPQPLPVAA